MGAGHSVNRCFGPFCFLWCGLRNNFVANTSHDLLMGFADYQNMSFCFDRSRVDDVKLCL